MTLDPLPALVLVDLQKGIVSLPTAHSCEAVVARAASLAKAFRQNGLPVVLVNVAGSAPGRVDQQRSSAASFPEDWTELVPELAAGPEDHRITKRTWGAFTATDLKGYLADRGATQVVLAGIATSIGIESTARQAHELGLNVVLITDAMTDLHPDAHANSISRIFPRLGECTTTDELLARLPGRD